MNSLPITAAVVLGLLLLAVIGVVLVGRELRGRRGGRKEQVRRRREAEPTGTPSDAGSESDDTPVRLNIDAREREELLENARMLARDNPDKTAKLLRSWLQD